MSGPTIDRTFVRIAEGQVHLRRIEAEKANPQADVWFGLLNVKPERIFVTSKSMLVPRR